MVLGASQGMDSPPARAIDMTPSVVGRRPTVCMTQANREGRLDEPTEGHSPELLSNRKAGVLLLVFLASVILVLAVATVLLA